MGAQLSANRFFDRLARTHLRVLGRPRPSFQVCGLTGLAVAVALALTLVARRGLPLWPMLAIALAACATFFVLAFATKIVTGEEALVYYHHEIAVVVVAALLLAALRQPVLAYLDATLLGVGAFLAFGRIGCLMAGCCHGRPSAFGVCYRDEHAEIGLPRYFVGVRLFPIQAVESGWVACLVIVGALMIWRGAAPGAAFAFYVVLYDLGRFLFEWVRADLGRPYYAGFSEAQWISLALTWLVTLLGIAGLLPFAAWHPIVALGLSAAIVGVSLARRARGDDAHRIAEPQHVDEVGRALLRAGAEPAGEPRVVTTALGYRLSAGMIDLPAGPVRHVTISASQGPLRETSAAAFARLFRQLWPEVGFELLRGARPDVAHLVAQHPDGWAG
jgi:hypothetical protein